MIHLLLSYIYWFIFTAFSGNINILHAMKPSIFQVIDSKPSKETPFGKLINDLLVRNFCMLIFWELSNMLLNIPYSAFMPVF